MFLRITSKVYIWLPYVHIHTCISSHMHAHIEKGEGYHGVIAITLSTVMVLVFILVVMCVFWVYAGQRHVSVSHSMHVEVRE